VSLRTRLIAGMAVVALVLVGVALVITRTTQAYLLDQVDSQLTVAGGPRGLGGAGGPRPDQIPGSDDPRQGISSVFLARVGDDGDVTVLALPRLSGDDPAIPDLDRSTLVAAAESGQAITVDSDVDGERYRVRARLDERSGDLLVLGLPIANVDAAVTRLVRVEVAATLAVLAVLALVSWWVILLGVRPIKRMTAAASTIAGGDLSHRVPQATPGTEAGDLGVALNQMLSRIETAFDERAASEARLRRFIADASHELRTPVTTIRGYGELYRIGGLADQEQLDEAMRRTEQEATRMGNLVADMLQLARLDQGRELQRLPVRLDLLAADAAADARAVQPDRVVRVSLAATTVVGDEERLRQVLANVVGNALVHTPHTSDIGIDVRPEPTRPDGTGSPCAVLVVTDGGPGMDDATIAQAFERFYRADPSRSRHQGGSGLGLAIVDSIVAAHGGRVTMASDPTGGTTVTVCLPLQDDPTCGGAEST
jgi:two-component system, OmpR family, sensor kinase